MLSARDRLLIEYEYRRRKYVAEAKEKYYHSLANFVRDAWHIIEPASEYFHGWHIDAMCEHLQAVTDGKINRLLINVPPGMMKSLLVGVFWPCWEWGVRRLPHYRYLCASHSQSLAIRDNIRARRLIMSNWYQIRFGHVKLTTDQNAKIKFENTYFGFREAVAAGSITGSRGDRVIIDDPHSVEGAYSDAMRETTKLWFLEAVPTRLNKPKESAIIVVMQRLHDEDVSGIILQHELGYEHLCLPMEFESVKKCKTSIGFEDKRKEENELLFPERFSRDVVDKLKVTMGEYAAAGQLQQSPVPRGGSLIKAEWIEIVKEIPRNFSLIIQCYDTAFSTKTTNDYSVGTTWGVFNKKYYLIDRIKGRYEYPELLALMKAQARKHNPSVVLIENKASGQSLAQSLKRESGLNIKEINIGNDKFARAVAIAPIFEQKRICIKESDWNNDYITTLCRFPFYNHDDDVDSTTMAINHLEKLANGTMKQVRADVFTR